MAQSGHAEGWLQCPASGHKPTSPAPVNPAVARYKSRRNRRLAIKPPLWYGIAFRFCRFAVP